MKNEMTQYLLIAWNETTPIRVVRFQAQADDLDTRPYDNDCPVTVGSNETVMKEAYLCHVPNLKSLLIQTYGE